MLLTVRSGICVTVGLGTRLLNSVNNRQTDTLISLAFSGSGFTFLATSYSLSYDVVRCERVFSEWDYGFVLRRLYYWVSA